MSLIPFPFGQSYRWPFLAFVALAWWVFDLILLRLTEEGVSLKTTVARIPQGYRCHPGQCSLCVCGDIRWRARSEIMKACDALTQAVPALERLMAWLDGPRVQWTNLCLAHFSMRQGYMWDEGYSLRKTWSVLWKCLRFMRKLSNTQKRDLLS